MSTSTQRPSNTYVEQTTTTQTTTPGAMRNYPQSDYRSSGNYNRDQDYDPRHHGKWTASGESTDLENRSGSGVNRPFGNRSMSDSNRDRDYDRDYDRRDRDRDFSRDRDYSRDYDRRDRDYSRDRDYDRSRGMSYGMNNSGYDFTAGMPHYGQSYGSSSSFPYGSGSVGSHPYGLGLGMHHSYDTTPYHLGGYHSGYSQSYGYPHHATYGSSSYGYPHHYSAMTPYYGSGLGSGFGSGLGSGYGSRSLRSSSGFITPEADIYELGNDYIIEMDLPGHSKEHIETKREGNQLIILSKPPSRAHHNYHINERSLGQGHVHRKLYLPNDANAEAINANLTNGVLRLVIPRTAATTTTTVTPVTLGSTVSSTPIVTKDVTTTQTTTTRI